MNAHHNCFFSWDKGETQQKESEISGYSRKFENSKKKNQKLSMNGGVGDAARDRLLEHVCVLLVEGCQKIFVFLAGVGFEPGTPR